MSSRLEKRIRHLEQQLNGLEKGQSVISLSSEAGEVVVVSNTGLKSLAGAAVSLNDYLLAIKRGERAQNRQGFG